MSRYTTWAVLSTVISYFALLASTPCLSESKTPTLVSGAAQAIYLAPMDPTLAPGHKFDKTSAEKIILNDPDLSALRERNEWCRIPTWLAGRWHRKETTFTLRRDQATGKEDKSRRVIDSGNNSSKGAFVDRAGQVWHYEGTGYWSQFDRKDTIHYHFMLYKNLVSSTTTECTLCDHFINFVVSKKTGKILITDQWESEQTLQPISDTELTVIGHLKKFDWHGKLLGIPESEATVIRTEEFKSNFKRRGSNGELLYPLFVEYLQKHDMADRIPDSKTQTEEPEHQS